MEDKLTYTDNEIRKAALTDRAGNGRKCIYVDGFPMLDVPQLIGNIGMREHFQNIKDLNIRDDDVILAAYPKSGTHWLWEVIHMLRGKTTDYQKQVKEKQTIELSPTGAIDNQPLPRVLNTHLWVRHLPKQIAQKKTKIIYLNRNPKDTAVSMYFFTIGIQRLSGYTGKWSDWVDQYLHKDVCFGTWFEHLLKWEKFIKSTDHPLFVLSYEQMKKDPKHHVKEIAQFLEIEVSDALVTLIVEKCSFKNLKKANEEYKEDVTKSFWSEGFSMYRKGRVGDWKNHFTVAENEEFDRVIQEKLKDSKWNFDF